MSHHRRRRKHHTPRRHKRRRVGAVSLGNTSMLLKLGSLAAGYFLADTINPMIDKVLPKTTDTTTNTQVPNQTIGIIGELGIGGLLLMKRTGKGMAGKALTVAGGILAGAGVQRTMKKMGVIKGYQSVPVIGRPKMAGYQSVPVVGKIPSVLGKIPGALQGYRVNGPNGYVPHGSGAGVMGAIGNIEGGLNYSAGSGYMG